MLQLKAAWEFIKANIRAILYVIAFVLGWYFCSLSYKADIEKQRRDAAENAQKLQGALAEIQTKYDKLKTDYEHSQGNTTIYVDRWKIKKECRVTNAFQQIHDNSVDGNSNLPPDGFVDDYNNITCEQAAQVIRWNYLEANKKDAQIKGLQDTVIKMKDAIERSGR